MNHFILACRYIQHGQAILEHLKEKLPLKSLIRRSKNQVTDKEELLEANRELSFAKSSYRQALQHFETNISARSELQYLDQMVDISLNLLEIHLMQLALNKETASVSSDEITEGVKRGLWSQILELEYLKPNYFLQLETTQGDDR